MAPERAAAEKQPQLTLPRARVPSGTRIGRPPGVPVKMDPRMVSEDAYVDAMVRDQARQFLTEGDNQIHATRLPSPFRRALVPSPQGQARANIAYFDMMLGEPEQEVGPPLWLRVKAKLANILRKLRAPAQDPWRVPLIDPEAGAV